MHYRQIALDWLICCSVPLKLGVYWPNIAAAWSVAFKRPGVPAQSHLASIKVMDVRKLNEKQAEAFQQVRVSVTAIHGRPLNWIWLDAIRSFGSWLRIANFTTTRTLTCFDGWSVKNQFWLQWESSWTGAGDAAVRHASHKFAYQIMCPVFYYLSSSQFRCEEGWGHASCGKCPRSTRSTRWWRQHPIKPHNRNANGRWIIQTGHPIPSQFQRVSGVSNSSFLPSFFGGNFLNNSFKHDLNCSRWSGARNTKSTRCGITHRPRWWKSTAPPDGSEWTSPITHVNIQSIKSMVKVDVDIRAAPGGDSLNLFQSGSFVTAGPTWRDSCCRPQRRITSVTSSPWWRRISIRWEPIWSATSCPRRKCSSRPWLWTWRNSACSTSPTNQV